LSAFLLDVNVLIALVDPNHIHHDAAHEWFQDEGHPAWATCPLTENGLLRIVGHPRYPNSPGSPAAVAHLLVGLRALPGHQFWADDTSLTDPARVAVDRLLVSSQVTDTYLLSLAVARGGYLATFDRRLVTNAVRGGDALLRVLA
jgi:uncharacterized protein